MNNDIAKARSIFISAVEEFAPAEWDKYLDDACRDNIELRRRVELLLQAHEGEDSLLDRGNETGTAKIIDNPIAEGPGTVIGPYKLLQQIGEGGFGVVFLAEQERPVRRRVALKIIKPGMDTREVIARFEVERQALALMNHPNIAKVFDAETTESGRPYFAMELVQGVPITEYCDACDLGTRQRLELFVTVCHAVQHAHQRGIIHRDIKPTNVLVALQDGRPAPKIIDFGIAKAVNQQFGENSLVTAFTQMVGTPLYMSPEQAELSPLGADTRSDIYSLGVLLYELLTGTTPFDKHRLHSAGYEEMRRIIREEEPPRPSTRLSTLMADAGSTVAERRRSDAHRLVQAIRGELDWIVLKCLEKDRNRRYATVGALIEDVQHYLKDEPVEACPPSVAYRFHKFVRRNRGVLTAAGLLAAVLILGTTLSVSQAVRATRAERLAQTRYEAERRARQETDAARRAA
jgi:serine/threonine protein kinase